MNPKIISAIAFKLFAIYILASVIIAVPTVIGTYIAMRNQISGVEASLIWPVVIAVTTIILAIIAFIILWKIGNGTIKTVSEINETDTNLDLPVLEKTLFVLLGVYFSVSAFVDLPNMAASLWVKSHAPTGVSITDYAWPLSLVVQFLIGLSLIQRLDKWLLLVRNITVK